MSRRLRELVSLLPSSTLIGGDADLLDITLDSRSVAPGSLFCATRGTRFDGHDFVADAISRGAVAILVARPQPVEVPQLVVPSVRHAIGRIASFFFGDPSHALDLIGVTGTNGKTTTSYLIDSILSKAGRTTGLIGTIEAKFRGANMPSVYTTPEGPDLNRLLARMRSDDIDSVVMEVSSHGIDQHRVDSTRFRIGVFTNLSPEHLDYHGTMEQYYSAKAQLFVAGRTQEAVVGTDTEWGWRLASQLNIPHLTHGPDPRNDLVVSEIGVDTKGTVFTVSGQGRRLHLRVPIMGLHNAYNAAAAVGVGVLLGIGDDAIVTGIEECQDVAGRFERIDLGQPFHVIVDYAHTPDAVRSLVETARVLSGQGKVILVAGARGRRDRLKRPELGRAAATANLAVLTTDNPGDEDPHEIVAQLLAGTLDVAQKNMVVEIDRGRAIRRAILTADPGDTVLIVGRGHEQTLRVGGSVIDMDDREEARAGIRLWLDRE
ncbi:MAG: UDP-N-acetylmuramoyl-L-alanyl-D-glutamate--2,6-diaminopimelate ligase [Ferrimicrobium sp.]